MITVYCQKLDSSWLTPEMYGILGVVLGASISGLVAWSIQRSNNKSIQAIESKRNSVKLYSDFFLKDIIEFIDAEVAHMQHIYVSGAKEINEYPPHQKIMYAVDTSIRMFKDDALNEEYKGFVLQTNNVCEKVKLNDNQSALNEMVTAREMAALLKLKIYNKFS